MFESCQCLTYNVHRPANNWEWRLVGEIGYELNSILTAGLWAPIQQQGNASIVRRRLQFELFCSRLFRNEFLP